MNFSTTFLFIEMHLYLCDPGAQNMSLGYIFTYLDYT